jgi:26S proteasome regulatory subunit N6
LDDVSNLLNGKFAVKYAGRSIEAMRQISKAHGDKKLQEFSDVLKEY